MKLISLNCWGGRLHSDLLKFIQEQSKSVDVFCLQEVFSTESAMEFSGEAKINLYQDISKILHDNTKYFGRKSKGYDYTGFVGHDINFGNSLFVTPTTNILSYEEYFGDVTHPNHDWTKTATPKAQFIKILLNEREVLICNYHGLWVNGTGKKDTPDRLAQSRELRTKLDSFACEVVLCGDFNLLPDTESYSILTAGMRDLVQENNITSTRSRLYTKSVGFADYVLVTNGVKVNEFKVLPDVVSDHLPLLLDFS